MCKNFKFFNATYGPLNMDPCTGNSSTLGNFTRFQVVPFTSVLSVLYLPYEILKLCIEGTKQRCN